MFFFFFFQAEDGIRDLTVTGVQTCALPISARACLTLLSGRRHRVYGGVAVMTPSGETASRRVVSHVSMKRLSEAELDAYLKSGEWHGKAGGYAIQGCAAAFIPWLAGSYSNVVGLPLFETAQLLAGRGYRPRCAASS